MTITPAPSTVFADLALADRLATSKRLAGTTDLNPSDPTDAGGYDGTDDTRTDALSRLVLSIAARPTHWRDLVAFGRTERYWARLESPAGVDLWLLTWLPSQGTELHDHGDSAAAFVVVGGTLAEARADTSRGILDSDLYEGHVQTVERGVVHDVRNTSSEPAVSIHAYSPRLTSMTFYDLTAEGLAATRTIETDEPEL
jgi:mannose-6-phosphate isomerase-like protein (cupin superfamily)